MECTSTGAVRYSHLVMRLTRSACPSVTTMPPDAARRDRAVRRARGRRHRPAPARGRGRPEPDAARGAAPRRVLEGGVGPPAHPRRWRGPSPTQGVRGGDAGVPPRRAAAGAGRSPATTYALAVRRLPELLAGLGIATGADDGRRPLGRRAPRAVAGHDRPAGRPSGGRAGPGVRPARGDPARPRRRRGPGAARRHRPGRGRPDGAARRAGRRSRDRRSCTAWTTTTCRCR